MSPAAPTSDQSFTIYGTADPLGTLSYQIDKGADSYAPVDANGHWAVTVGPLAPGSHTFAADVSDQAGNWAGFPGGPPTGMNITIQSPAVVQTPPTSSPAHLINISARA